MAEALRAQKRVLQEEEERGFIPKERRASQRTRGWCGQEAQLWAETARLRVPALHLLRAGWVEGGHNLHTLSQGGDSEQSCAAVPDGDHGRMGGGRTPSRAGEKAPSQVRQPSCHLGSWSVQNQEQGCLFSSHSHLPLPPCSHRVLAPRQEVMGGALRG